MTARDTIGKQMVRAVDGIGANIAEGSGRGSDPDNRRFLRMARGSRYELKHWLRRGYRRGLLTDSETNRLKPLVDALAPMLNACLGSIGRAKSDKNQEPKTEDRRPKA